MSSIGSLAGGITSGDPSKIAEGGKGLGNDIKGLVKGGKSKSKGKSKGGGKGQMIQQVLQALLGAKGG